MQVRFIARLLYLAAFQLPNKLAILLKGAYIFHVLIKLFSFFIRIRFTRLHKNDSMTKAEGGSDTKTTLATKVSMIYLFIYFFTNSKCN